MEPKNKVIRAKDFADANALDKRVPADLLMKYQNKVYILKAGLEWKANYLFGGGQYGVTTELIDIKPDFVLAKATFTTRDGMVFSNYGEASKANTTPNMQKYLIHLAITRAECRVLRMATACGYTSADEMNLGAEGETPAIPIGEDDDKAPTQLQEQTLTNMGVKKADMPKTQKEAKEKLAELVAKK